MEGIRRAPLMLVGTCSWKLLAQGPGACHTVLQSGVLDWHEYPRSKVAAESGRRGDCPRESSGGEPPRGCWLLWPRLGCLFFAWKEGGLA